MTSEERREKIEIELRNNIEPITATALAKKFSVSRQIIVGDIALMRASGIKISATPRGYIINGEVEKNEKKYTIACCHDDINMAEELYTVVDNGGTLLDVTVEHPIYGQIVGQLHISSRYDADLFLKKVENNQAQPLMRLTGGIHLHTIKCKDDDTFDRIMKALKNKNIILEQK
ncbi:MAG: transcription repressor NadR [Sedimentibacter sp.]|uniref:transcription repressor NadR n=1 Tax=Sedimentibacter sp. TaxID=1960295 RepID=UPI0029824D50|nr:transcription repressor NadR [Sedimentibacter sp.]MDW5298586.1 transcription repressor NadR [Sedimentibacter sp.]